MLRKKNKEKKIFIKELRPDMTECRLILVEKKKNEKKNKI